MRTDLKKKCYFEREGSGGIATRIAEGIAAGRDWACSGGIGHIAQVRGTRTANRASHKMTKYLDLSKTSSTGRSTGTADGQTSKKCQ